LRVAHRWQDASDELQCQIINRVNAELMYEKIPEAPEKVIHWRMETLLNQRIQVCRSMSC
jgi:hypothetical protein